MKGERWEILCDVPPNATDDSRTREKVVEPVRLVVPRLQPNRLYRFAVRAENAHGRSPFSKSAEARALGCRCAVPPVEHSSACSDCTVRPVAGRIVQAACTARGRPNLMHGLRRGTAPNLLRCWWMQRARPLIAQPLRRPVAPYRVQSGSGQVRTASEPPGVVGPIEVVDVGADKIALRWMPPATDGGSPILRYEVWSARPAPPPTRLAVDKTAVPPCPRRAHLRA